MNTHQHTKAIAGLTYSFNSRYNSTKDAKAKAQELANRYKHVYYTRVKEKGNAYYDVRTSNN